jgi:hypothetical protein
MLTDVGDSFLLAENPPINPNASNIFFFGIINEDQSFSELTFVKTSLIDGIGFDEMYFSTVPTPATVWLFSSGLIGLIGLARRKPLVSK